MQTWIVNGPLHIVTKLLRYCNQCHHRGFSLAYLVHSNEVQPAAEGVDNHRPVTTEFVRRWLLASAVAEFCRPLTYLS